jgi:hypothetical protein
MSDVQKWKRAGYKEEPRGGEFKYDILDTL